MRPVVFLLAGMLSTACAARAPLARPDDRRASNASLSSAKQDDGERPTLTYRRLSDDVPGTCELAPWIDGIGGSCTRVAPVSVTTSSGVDATLLGDGDVCIASTFNSGAGAPHEIVVELPEGTSVSAVVYVAEQTPDGVTSQVVEISADGTTWTELGTLRGHTVTGHVYAAAARRAASARFLRLRTVESPSWVAFRELAVVSCARRARLSGSTVPRRSPVDHSGDRWARGSGACERSSDCSYDDCCNPRTCVADADAPRCTGVGCPRVHRTEIVTCACRRGTCGAWITPDLSSIGGMETGPAAH